MAGTAERTQDAGSNLRLQSLLRLGAMLVLSCGLIFAAKHFAAGLRQARLLEGPTLGERLPDFSLMTLEGSRASSLQWGDRNTLWILFRVNCSHCRACLPEVEQQYAALRQAGWSVVLVSASAAAESRALMRELRISIPMFLDDEGSMQRRLNLLHVPAFLWYRNRVLIRKTIGANGISDLTSIGQQSGVCVADGQ